jgi:hypothetical protein
MSSTYKHMVFSQIITMGKLPDGRIVDRVISYPEGADYEDYMRLDDAMVTAFGSINCRTIGVPFYGRQRKSTVSCTTNPEHA